MKKIIITILLLCLIKVATAENDTIAPKTRNEVKTTQEFIRNSFILGNINVGGNIGFGFANNYSYINFQPRVSYQLSRWVIPGISLVYQYSKQDMSSYDLKYHTWGAGVFAQIYPAVRFAYAHIEYQHLWYSQKNTSDGTKLKDHNNYLLVGGGVHIPISTNLFLNASILFNLLNDKHNIYENPIYNVGFGVRF